MTLDASDVAAALRACLRVVRTHEAELNRLNVFPVPDHDTGTNLAGTLDAIVRELDAAAEGAGFGALAAAVADGGHVGARGNAGVIVAEALRGLTSDWADLVRVDADALALGFRAASRHADQAVLQPVKGTILTVARVTSEELGALRGVPVAARLDQAARATRRAVASTRWQLNALRAAGVVDAGGQGWALCVGAFAAVANGRHLVSGPPGRTGNPDVAGVGRSRRFEVQYQLACSEAAIESLRAQLAAIGDSIVVTGTRGRYRIHVHTDEADAAVKAAAKLGRLSHVEVTGLPNWEMTL